MRNFDNMIQCEGDANAERDFNKGVEDCFRARDLLRMLTRILAIYLIFKRRKFKVTSSSLS